MEHAATCSWAGWETEYIKRYDEWSGVECRHLNWLRSVRLVFVFRRRNTYGIQKWTVIGDYERCESCPQCQCYFRCIHVSNERACILSGIICEYCWTTSIVAHFNSGQLDSNKAFASKVVVFLLPNTFSRSCSKVGDCERE
jgi:hypothetical protein